MEINVQYEKIYTFCYFKVRNRDAAEDITQETFLKYFEAAQYIEKGKKLPFLYTIARNELQTISEEETHGYYEKRIAQYRLNLENNPTFTQENVDRVIENDKLVPKPFAMAYTDGYKRFFEFTTTNAFLAMFLIVFVPSPMFVNEYSQKTESLHKFI